MKLTIKDICVFGFLGALMFASKILMEVIPNVHLVGVFITAFTVVYRWKALYPIYVFVILCGLYEGFTAWWIPYLYVWTILWAVVMLLPKRMPVWLSVIVYSAVCSMHGFLFGVLWAPAQAILLGLDLERTVAWIAAGFPFDVVHGVGNLGLGLAIVPIINLLRRLEKRR